MPERPAIRAALVGLLVLGMLTPQAHATDPEPWKESRYNPSPLEDDVILPMPCGGAMAFRPVTTLHIEQGMSDTVVELGAEAGDYGYLRGRRDMHLSGSLRGKDLVEIETLDGSTVRLRPRLYYMAKYETSQPQYDVVMTGCPEKRLRRSAFVPATGLTWFDAVAFSRAYSVWLAENATDELFLNFGTMAFVRLPTEAEWEFAARGGDAVSRADFRQKHYPTGDSPLEAHEAYRTSVSGKVQPIGAFRANPLGLHDMLGNVSELVLEPFRLVRQGRAHGRTGGFVARGGHANSDAAQIAAATRAEVRFFHPETGAMVTDPRMGFRTVLGTIAVETDEDARAFAAASQAASAPDTGVASGAAEAAALDRLEGAGAIEDPADRRRALDEIARELDVARAERNDQRNRAIEALFMAASAACHTAVQQTKILAQDRRRLDDALPAINEIRKLEASGRLTAAERAQLPDLKERFRNIETRHLDSVARVRTQVDNYSEFIAALQKDYSAEITDPVVALTRARLDGDGPTEMGACLGIAAEHLSLARLDGQMDIDQWRQDFKDMIED